MPRIRMENIVESLRPNLSAALERAVTEVLPDSEVDRNALYQAFLRAVRARFNTWERVPNNAVENE